MDLQQLCEQGQQQLMEMKYLRAEKTLMQAEQLAIAQKDFDSLSRLYMPLQEARRQRRQRCGEGIVCLDLIADAPGTRLDPELIIKEFPHGQVLVAGWGTVEPALKLRQLQTERGLYVETFLAAVYPAGSGRAVVIVPTPDVKLPDPSPRSIDQLLRLLPAHSIVIGDAEIPARPHRGNTETFARVMSIWERLHLPFLAAAEACTNSLQRITVYRQTIEVDYACELAHQNLSAAAAQIARARLQSTR
ncbi:MAG TPA: hypothetical protein VHD56_10175 [Tepidisphaeraceae bacterium]|nr:hypothetical protein [Tepidisphaeraceae bacterium]